MTPAQVTTPAELAHRDRLRRKHRREHEVRELRKRHVGDSGMSSEELLERFRSMKRDTLARHPEWRVAA